MKTRWIFILITLIGLTSCEDINRRSPVPYVPVSYTLNITSEYPHFVVDNGYQTMTITQRRYEYDNIGYAGLLVWIAMDGQYHAADLCCPHCLKKNQPVEVEGLYAICPICDEHFDLSFGFAYPTQGVTKDPLRQYRVSRNESFTGLSLRIIN